MKKFLFLLAATVFICGSACADELLKKEAVGYYNDGVQAQRDGDYAKADVCYHKVELVDPGKKAWKKRIINNYGVIYARAGEFDDAERAFREVLSIDPHYIPARINLGLIYDKRRDRLTALEYWLKFLAIDVDRLKPKDFDFEFAPDSDKPAEKK